MHYPMLVFVFCQAIGGKARKLGMTKTIKKDKKVRSLVRQLGVIPLLPSRHIKDGFKVICRTVIRWGKSRKMVRLLEYWAKTWWPKRHLLSVSGSQERTSNASESDNHSLQVAVRQKNPSVWDFMGK